MGCYGATQGTWKNYVDARLRNYHVILQAIKMFRMNAANFSKSVKFLTVC